jgi:hypothetical protein
MLLHSFSSGRTGYALSKPVLIWIQMRLNENNGSFEELDYSLKSLKVFLK